MNLMMNKAELLIGIAVFAIFSLDLFIQLNSYVLLVSIVIQAMFYFWGGIPLFMKKSLNTIIHNFDKSNENIKNVVFSAICGALISFTLSGIAFYIMKFPGANYLVYYIIALFVTMIYGMFYFYKTKQIVFKRVLYRLIIFIVFGVLIYFRYK